ncbi:YybH family protein [Sphingomonas sp. R86520]|uniref:YybH family protein n=1 Tax=Sphingomonas sp. R86520 TaxID=3093859 RepID=UPI0036D39AA7
MMRRMMLPLALVTLAAAPARMPAETAIREGMDASAAGWNAGDLVRFMDIYADDAVFVTPKGLLRGKNAISAKYRPSFRSTGNARGRLSFAFLEMRGLDPAHAMLFARWTLTGSSTTESGMTTLVFERRGTMWRIIADHSS